MERRIEDRLDQAAEHGNPFPLDFEYGTVLHEPHNGVPGAAPQPAVDVEPQARPSVSCLATGWSHIRSTTLLTQPRCARRACQCGEDTPRTRGRAGASHARHTRAWLVACVAIGTVWARPSGAQIPAGRIEERVASVTDTLQAYALYLPPGYGAGRLWPTLLVMDPRGRAMLALDRFRGAAERLGWIVLSSYNTLSDGPMQPTVDALNAMLASAQARLAVDPERLYLAGFSGTSRAALGFAVALRGRLAGVIAVGGALGFALGGPETAFAGDSTFAVFGAAGTGDFNYEEMFALGDRFRTTRVPYRIVPFDGPHSWPPAELCGEALDWLELRAMMGGRRAVDSAWIRARLETEVARAAELDRLGRWAEALRLDEAIARDYAPRSEATAAAARGAALRSSATVTRYEAEARRLADADLQQSLALPNTFAWARAQAAAPSVETLTKKLHIAELERRVEQGDSLEASSARRVLARVLVNLAFYEPRAYLAAGAPERALRMFEAAVTIGPIQGEGCALLHAALDAATAEQRARLAGQCAA